MTDNNFIIGNITRVRWHACLHKVAQYNYGHMIESYDEGNVIVKEVIEIKDSDGNITNTYPYKTLNQNMNPDKNYAIVTLDNYGNIFVRNFFDSKHPEGFEQKNTYYQDDIANKFMMSDENNILLNYIKLGCPEVTTIKNIDNYGWLYFCIEYKINDGVNPNLLNYCISLENKYSQMEHRLKNVEEKIEKQEKSQTNVANNQNSHLSHFKFHFF